MTACIIGWAHTPFGKLGTETVESLIVKVANEALDHAGIGPEEVNEILLGHFNAGFSEQDFTASIVLQANDAFRFKPATRVENACATGTAAVREAIKTVEAKRAKITLVVGVEQMTHAPNPEIARNLLESLLLRRGWRDARRFCRRVRQDCRVLLPAPRGPVRRARHDRGQEPQERRCKPLRADPQGLRL